MSHKENKKEETDIEFIPLSGAAKLSGYTPEYLNSLSRQGVLRAKKIGRNWHTTREWLGAFLELQKKGEIENQETEIREIQKSKIQNSKSQINSKALRQRRISPWLKNPKLVLSKVEGSETEDIEGEEDTIEKNDREISEAAASGAVKDYRDAWEKEVAADEIVSAEAAALKENLRRPEWFQLFSALASMVIALPLVFAASGLMKTTFKNINGGEDLQRLAENSELDGASTIVNEGDMFGEVRGEEDVNSAAEKKSGIFSASENFKISQISFGGVALAMGDDHNLPLEISETRSESFVTGKSGKAKLIVSWKTNKLASSELAYSKNNGQNFKTIGESSYGFTHNAIISDLDPGTSYVYSIKCKDHWGVEIVSDSFGAYTVSKPASVFDLISRALNEIFGWALS
ncbi:MAG: hypothetical protein A2288_02365 [Candidatus Moranbacteria bacterium RIFOXYA12_FULL_44_15]|nr:MAG: hypothetical protein A2288_02365 [Candidatus Moranbacteria bacterium RIFOXYA12_FULL_44_15]